MASSLQNATRKEKPMESMLVNAAAFFAAVRVDLCGGVLKQTQVDGISSVLDTCAAANVTDWRWSAYILATDYHETGPTMQPVPEWGRGQGRPYGVRCGPYQQICTGAASSN
jgi:hypothetical protein